MKKVLSLLLAVVLVCSMATVAFAGSLTNTCNVCGYSSDVLSDFTAHKNAKTCALCPYCENTGCKDAAELAEHTYICEYADIVCDYCGDTWASHEKFDNHIAGCKQNHFYIPFAKIVEVVKAYFAKIDFKRAFEGAKDFFGYVVPVVKDIVGGITK